MQMPGRSFSQSIKKYRYGFNGKENDNEVKGEGNELDYGARVYDSRIGRWLSVDPQYYRGNEYSPYIQAFDNPISFVDEKGAWSIITHYRMVKHALMNAGINKATAKEIAYYASTYADGGHGFILTLNKAIGIFGGTAPINLAKTPDGDKSVIKESQSDMSVQMVSIHAMQAAYENLKDDKVAVDRALKGGIFTEKDKNGNDNIIVIEGALNVINRFKGHNIEKLSTEEKQELGVAFHTIADAEAHQGKRWVNSKLGKEKAKALGYKNEHNLFHDLFGFGGMKKAKEKTRDAIMTIQDKK